MSLNYVSSRNIHIISFFKKKIADEKSYKETKKETVPLANSSVSSTSSLCFIENFILRWQKDKNNLLNGTFWPPKDNLHERLELYRKFLEEAFVQLEQIFITCSTPEEWFFLKNKLFQLLPCWYTAFLRSLNLNELTQDVELSVVSDTNGIILDYLVNANSVNYSEYANTVIRRYFPILKPLNQDLRDILTYLENTEEKFYNESFLKYSENNRQKYKTLRDKIWEIHCFVSTFNCILLPSKILDCPNDSVAVPLPFLLSAGIKSLVIHFCKLLESCSDEEYYELCKIHLVPAVHERLLSLLKYILKTVEICHQCRRDIASAVSDEDMENLITIFNPNYEVWKRLLAIHASFNSDEQNIFNDWLIEFKTIMDHSEYFYRVNKASKKPAPILMNIDHEDWVFGKAQLQISEALSAPILRSFYVEVIHFLMFLAMTKYKCLLLMHNNKLVDDTLKKINKEFKIFYHPDKISQRIQGLVDTSLSTQIYHTIEEIYCYLTTNLNPQLTILDHNVDKKVLIRRLTIIFDSYLNTGLMAYDTSAHLFNQIQVFKTTFNALISDSDSIVKIGQSLNMLSNNHRERLGNNIASLLAQIETQQASLPKYIFQIEQITSNCERLLNHQIEFTPLFIEFKLTAQEEKLKWLSKLTSELNTQAQELRELIVLDPQISNTTRQELQRLDRRLSIPWQNASGIKHSNESLQFSATVERDTRTGDDKTDMDKIGNNGFFISCNAHSRAGPVAEIHLNDDTPKSSLT